MNITLVGPVYPYRGGIAHYTTLLARALQSSGHSVQVISFRRQYPAWLYPGSSDKDPSREPLQVNAEYLLDPIAPWTWHRTAHQIADSRPDLVVIMWWTTFWAGPFAFLRRSLQRKGLRVIFLIHNVLPHEERPQDVWLAKLALNAADAFIVQTSQERKRLLRLIPCAVTWECPHPVYSMLAHQQVPKEEARQKLQLPADQQTLLMFGIVRPYKGLRVLLEALHLLRGSGQEPYLLVAGEFWDTKDEYLRLVETYGISSQVRFDDRYIPNEEVGLLFSAADAMVAPYTAATQSGAAGMAIGFGLPLIVTEPVAAGLAAIDPADLYVAPAGDAVKLARAISSFLTRTQPSTRQPRPTPDDWQRLVDTLTSIQANPGGAVDDHSPYRAAGRLE